MRSSARNAITNDALRIERLDLLPAQVSGLMKVLEATDLEVQTILADEKLSTEL